ncbi:hypothetical protein OPKNFCMD_4367 [Methylobacterium crusticola]|uniref:Spore protein YkvP/CgeB glycosyl transferase-like domain-containing protein n=1 Tax=Methylobacterium crusticola TaxID=1697972 RepID=A0ABQ4R1Q8_9HYPH|nr:glycosyltransferase [Methylobacterium crusticola]GJD51612.1 hypothetical protein OPKNFCMD_4367 [Methylobacterium crusticola]
MAERPLSVLVTGTVEDRLNSNTAIRRYIARGLRDLGPQVAVREVGYGALIASPGIGPVDVVVAVGGVAVDASNLTALRRIADGAGAALAFWVHDDPYEFDYSFRLRGIADLVFNTDRWSTAHYGDTPAVHLPLAGCLDTHFRPIDPAEPRDLTVFFCGYAYGNRIDFLRESTGVLRKCRTYVCGAEWPRDIPFARNERMTPDMFADTAARALFTLNIGRDLSIANARFSLSPSTPGPRTFEVALMGSAQLFLAEGLEILDYFEPDREIVLIDGPADLKRWIERAQDDPASIVAIARRAQERALSEHCYVHRAEAAVAHLVARGLVRAPAGTDADLVPLGPAGFVPAIAAE